MTCPPPSTLVDHSVLLEVLRRRLSETFSAYSANNRRPIHRTWRTPDFSIVSRLSIADPNGVVLITDKLRHPSKNNAMDSKPPSIHMTSRRSEWPTMSSWVGHRGWRYSSQVVKARQRQLSWLRPNGRALSAFSWSVFAADHSATSHRRQTDDEADLGGERWVRRPSHTQRTNSPNIDVLQTAALSPDSPLPTWTV